MPNYQLSHLDQIEAEAIFILRETAAQFQNPGLLFSGGKDSIVMAWIARKAFHPARMPFPLVHVDTGHNFPETITYRDDFAEKMDARLVVGSVQKSIDDGRVVEEKGPNASRNRAQTTTLLDTIAEYQFDALLGGGRRDEEKARAKERIFSHRDAFGQWQPKDQRPELWTLFNTRLAPGEHFRVFPISNWTELDVWQYIERENVGLPSIYYTHKREVVERRGLLLPLPVLSPPLDGETIQTRDVRFRTVGDITTTCPVESLAGDAGDVVLETLSVDVSERGATRMDDMTSEASMEKRKKDGYF